MNDVIFWCKNCFAWNELRDTYVSIDNKAEKDHALVCNNCDTQVKAFPRPEQPKK